MSVVTYS